MLLSFSAVAENGGSSNTTPFTGPNPYYGVNSYVGDIYMDIDPDYAWLVKTKQKLDSMPAGQNLSKEKYNKIVQRQTEIQYKDDNRQSVCKQLRVMGKADVNAHYAMELDLPMFRLDSKEIEVKSKGMLFRKTRPMEPCIRKILEWYYEFGKLERRKEVKEWGLQRLISKVFSYVNAKDDYDYFFDAKDKKNLDQIYNDPKDFLNKTKKTLKEHKCRPDLTNRDYLNLGDGLIIKVALLTDKAEAKIELINNTDKFKEFHPLNYIFVGPQCETFVLGLGEVDFLENPDSP